MQHSPRMINIENNKCKITGKIVGCMFIHFHTQVGMLRSREEGELPGVWLTSLFNCLLFFLKSLKTKFITPDIGRENGFSLPSIQFIWSAVLMMTMMRICAKEIVSTGPSFLQFCLGVLEIYTRGWPELYFSCLLLFFYAR